MKPRFFNPGAMRSHSRPVLWTQDKAPHRRGTFEAAVLEGESQSMSAGPSTSGVIADPWNVMAALDVALVADMAIGDTLQLAPNGPTLCIQQITRAPYWWQIRCTANERAPN